MIACDFDLRFVYVRAGWEGSASDARIHQRSIEQGFEVPRGKYYLVDEDMPIPRILLLHTEVSATICRSKVERNLNRAFTKNCLICDMLHYGIMLNASLAF